MLEATILGCPKPAKPCFLKRKTTISANAPNSVPTALWRGISADSVPFGTHTTRISGCLLRCCACQEPQKVGLTRRLIASKPPNTLRSRAQDPKPTNRCPKTDDAASPERPKRRFWDARSLENLPKQPQQNYHVGDGSMSQNKAKTSANEVENYNA